MESLNVRQEIISTACDFNVSGISAGTSGNLSARHENGFLITPSGFAYNDLKPDDIILCDLKGIVLSGELIPSSEWPFHAAIYAAHKDVNAIVHVHSPYATGLACTRKPIPAFHYMVAVAGGDSIPCADYATFGTDEISKNIVAVLTERKACLLANHGTVAVGNSISSAYRLANEVEALAKQYCISMQLGGPVMLDDAEMEANIEKFNRYGKQNIDE